MASSTPCKAPARAPREAAEGSRGIEDIALLAHFLDLSEEVYGTTLLFLHGYEAGGAAAVCKRLGRLLSQGQLWPSFTRQEFPYAPESGKAGLARYAALRTREQCRAIEWRRVPAYHRLAGREGWPSSFAWRGHVFFFGGWEHGNYDFDLHVGRLAVPLVLTELPIEGQPPRATYAASVVVLDEGLEDEPEGACHDGSEGRLRVLVSGGYLFNGYHLEGSMFGLLEVSMQADGALSARWERVGELTPRGNHCSAYVPPRLAGPQFPAGYVVVVGGIIEGTTVSSIGILDLSTFAWAPSVAVAGGAEVQRPRNSHSATLLRRADGSYGILVVGGGTGDGNNGNPPRGGEDLRDGFWLVGLENAALECSGPAVFDDSVPGRGHVACRLRGTSTLLTLCGGFLPTARATAFVAGRPRAVRLTGGEQAPARAFGCGCALPDGVVLVYGGYSCRLMTHKGDIWAARVVGTESEFFEQLPSEPDPQATAPQDRRANLDAAVVRALLWPDSEEEEEHESEDESDGPEEEEDGPEAEGSSSSEPAANALLQELSEDLDE